ncbi:MAG: carboxypeptidase regulatory-like domain-containing protein, partial [Gammaproteobacteria bacterium]|nr:carboxypeptidase regulatory-like domain-containing protein [Gammaproteobacteria bacterium]NNL51311.1 TonB-dependent receptor [Woeseiaceae bacterium]
MNAKALSLRLLPVILATFFATVAVPTLAVAQDYTTNTIEGVVRDTTGQAIQNATVVVTSDRGVRRTSTSDDSGKFRMPQMPIGPYEVAVTAAGFDALTGMSIYNQVGSTGNYTITLMVEGAPIEEIVATGVRQSSIDFESNTSGISVDVEELQLKYPVARSITDVALFAPGTHLGEQDFNTRSNGKLASFSGGSVAENAYYINGLNVTNFRNFTGGSEIPFEFFEQVEVKTGGYQAEFGRSMGGFINSVSKSGSNDFKFQVTGYWTPDSLRGERKDVDVTWNSLDYDSDTQLILQMSGPIIEDRLFFYGLYNQRDVFERDYTTSSFTETLDDDPFYAAKIDFVPFEGHRLEYTYFTDQREIKQVEYNYNDAGLTRSEADGSEIGDKKGEGFTLAGGENHIFKYTANINDSFSVSALYGENTFDRTTASTADANPVIYERFNQTSSAAIGNWVNTFAASGLDERESLRVDADLYFEALGDHHIRLGFDEEDLRSDELRTLSGGQYWRYNICRNAAGCFGGAVAENEEWVRNLFIDQGGSFRIEQSAMYIQDSWQVTDLLTVNLGLRSEKFTNYNSLGEVFIKTKDEIAPRFGATFDLRGDGRTLLSAFWGRYYMPIASNTNIRLSGAELFTEGFYRHDGFANRNSDDTPSGVDLSNPIQFNAISDGEIPPVEITKAENVDALFSDEIILGFEHAFENDIVVGIRGVYRELTTQIDDIGINHAIVAWALENGYDINDVWEWMDPAQHGIEYVLANPGEGITVSTDTIQPLDGSTGLVRMNLTAEQLGYPKPQREFTSLEFTASKETERWGIDGSYVWSKNEGNTEGVVKSDNGQDDAGLTQDFDLVALSLNAKGPLPTE